MVDPIPCIHLHNVPSLRANGAPAKKGDIMSITRRGFLGMGAVSAAFLAACGAQNTQTNSSDEATNAI